MPSDPALRTKALESLLTEKGLVDPADVIPANAEGNNDGRDDNFSWNSGLEGETDDPVIQRLRRQRARNFTSVSLLARPRITGVTALPP